MPKAITTLEFVEALWSAFAPDRSGEGIRVGVSHGWLSPQDAKLSGEPLRRNTAAAILHEFLLAERGERDEEDWGAAKNLRDLYDCRVCVAHVAQVVAKGIMTTRGDAFGMRELLTDEEAKASIERSLHPEKRLGMRPSETREETAEDFPRPQKLSAKEAKAFLASNEDAAFFDVRTKGEYDEKHPKGAVSLPLLKLLSNPALAGEDLGRPILLGCDGGYRSEMAAQCLAQNGYKNLYYFGYDSFD